MTIIGLLKDGAFRLEDVRNGKFTPYMERVVVPALAPLGFSPSETWEDIHVRVEEFGLETPRLRKKGAYNVGAAIQVGLGPLSRLHETLYLRLEAYIDRRYACIDYDASRRLLRLIAVLSEDEAALRRAGMTILAAMHHWAEVNIEYMSEKEQLRRYKQWRKQQGMGK